MTTTLAYTYNAAGLRVEQSVGGSVTTYTWDTALPLAQVLATSDGARDVYGVGRIWEERGSAWAYPLGDALGSVRQWADGSADVTYAASYRPFGEVLEESGSTESAWGFTGEWWDSYLKYTYLRARWYDVETGRFTRGDPREGDRWEPQTLNGYVYSLNCPLTMLDPSGMTAGSSGGWCGSYCGPDVTQWFAEEIKIHWGWVEKEANWGILEPFDARDYFAALPYKWMNFSNLVPHCPTNDCKKTVTLCGTCIDRSELGNIVFGLSAKLWGFSAGSATWLAKKVADAVEYPWDETAVYLGYTMKDRFDAASAVNRYLMCGHFHLTKGSGYYFEGLSWATIQDPNTTQGCKPCMSTLPATTPHTTPAYGKDPKTSVYAGNKGNTYYTQQIPPGMLDPLLLEGAPSLPNPYGTSSLAPCAEEVPEQVPWQVPPGIQ